jgi:hypothetical protein
MPAMTSRPVGPWALTIFLAGGLAAPLQAQSGRASLHGWVAFEDIAYIDSQPRATVELRHEPPDTDLVYNTVTDAHGFFAFERTGLGPFVLRISAAHFRPYAAAVYLASDFLGNWAVLLRADSAGTAHE